MFEDEIKFVTGRSLNSVATDIRRDLEWTRVSVSRWTDDNGHTVHYLHDAAQLRGIRNSRVFLLPGFDERDNWWELDDMMRARGSEREVL